ncbi:MAG: hypothetical protein U1D67_05325 [Dehalococcoidia bacterium]|nr:hypothetical protein [Dehalococcoidia bacterium]
MQSKIEREILKLTRRRDGTFCFYADGKLEEVYEAIPDTWHALIPIKMWRLFNKTVEKRIKEMDDET